MSLQGLQELRVLKLYFTSPKLTSTTLLSLSIILLNNPLLINLELMTLGSNMNDMGFTEIAKAIRTLRNLTVLGLNLSQTKFSLNGLSELRLAIQELNKLYYFKINLTQTALTEMDLQKLAQDIKYLPYTRANVFWNY